MELSTVKCLFCSCYFGRGCIADKAVLPLAIRLERGDVTKRLEQRLQLTLLLCRDEWRPMVHEETKGHRDSCWTPPRQRVRFLFLHT